MIFSSVVELNAQRKSSMLTPSASLLVDDFSYATGQLTNTNAGANVSGGNWVGISGTTGTMVQVSSPGLTYTGYPGSGVGNKVDMLNGGAPASEDVARTFTAETGTTYYAFLLNVTNTTGIAANTSTTGDYFTGFSDSATTTNFIGRISIRAGSVADTFNIGVRHNSANATAAFAAADLAIGTTHLIVMKYEQPAGNTNNIASIFVNPTPATAEPAAQATQTSAMTTDPADVGKVFFRESATSPNASVDGVRVGTTWADVVGASTAAGVGISGSVMTAEGRGITNAVVTITGNALSEPRTVVTGRRGAYLFDDLEPGETYIVTVRARRFMFSNPSQVISLTDNIADADFIADGGTARAVEPMRKLPSTIRGKW